MLWPKADIHVFAAAVKLPMGEEFSPFYPGSIFFEQSRPPIPHQT